LWLSANSLYAYTLSNTQQDSSAIISVRDFNKSAIESFKADPEFNYSQGNNFLNGYEPSWISRLLKKLFGISFNEHTASIWEIIIYVLCGCILLFAVLNFVKADKRWFMQRSTKKAIITHEEVESNIHEMDMDELIKQALEQKQYRRAVRLLYLKSLKELSDKKLIDWSAQKTNSDYLNEIKSAPLKQSFKSNTLIFEYIWYGDFHIDEPLLQKVMKSFDAFINEIKSK